MEENSGLTSCRGNLRPPLSGEWRRRLNGGAERENDWAMIRYVDPEVTVVNGEGDGSDLGKALSKDMIYPAGPSGAVPGEVGDPVAELVGAKAQSGGWIPPAGSERPVLKFLSVRPSRFVRGNMTNIPGAVEITRKNR